MLLVGWIAESWLDVAAAAGSRGVKRSTIYRVVECAGSRIRACQASETAISPRRPARALGAARFGNHARKG